jgi:transposase
VLLDEGGEEVKRVVAENADDQIWLKLMELKGLVGEGTRVHVISEGSRSLGAVLRRMVVGLGMTKWDVNPRALKQYRECEGQPRKDDGIDAFLAGRMLYLGMRSCHLAVDPRPEEMELCRLTRLHTQLTGDRVSCMSRVRSRLLELCPEMLQKEWAGPSWSSDGVLAVLTRWPGFVGLEGARRATIEDVLRKAGSRRLLAAKAGALREMAKRIRVEQRERETIGLELRVHVEQSFFLGRSLAEVDGRIEELAKAHPIAVKLMEMPGVGPFTAAVLVGEALAIARNMTEAQLATYAGVTPLSRISGDGKKPSRLARGVNKHLLRAAFLSAQGSLRKSALDRAYYDKQRAQHKGHPVEHTVALIALARQRMKVMYKLLTTEVRYDKEKLISSHLERKRQEAAASGEGGERRRRARKMKAGRKTRPARKTGAVRQGRQERREDARPSTTTHGGGAGPPTPPASTPPTPSSSASGCSTRTRAAPCAATSSR